MLDAARQEDDEWGEFLAISLDIRSSSQILVKRNPLVATKSTNEMNTTRNKRVELLFLLAPLCPSNKYLRRLQIRAVIKNPTELYTWLYCGAWAGYPIRRSQLLVPSSSGIGRVSGLGHDAGPSFPARWSLSLLPLIWISTAHCRNTRQSSSGRISELKISLWKWSVKGDFSVYSIEDYLELGETLLNGGPSGFFNESCTFKFIYSWHCWCFNSSCLILLTMPQGDFLYFICE